MMRFRNVFTFLESILLSIAVIFFLNSSKGYGIDIQKDLVLRKPLDFDGSDTESGSKDNVINFRNVLYLKDVKNQGEEWLSKSAFTPNGEAWVEEKTLWGRKCYIVALRDHYSRRAVELFLNKIAPHVLKTDPDKWLFLVEKSLADTPEDLVFTEFAKGLGISIENPISSPYTHVTATLEGLDKFETAEAVVMAELRQFVDRSRDEVKESIKELVRLVSKQFDIDSGVLSVLIEKNISLDDKRLDKTQQTWNRLIEVSNDLSNRKICSIVNQHPEVTHIVVLIGGAHLPAFNSNHITQLNITEEEIDIAIRANDVVSATYFLSIPSIIPSSLADDVDRKLEEELTHSRQRILIETLEGSSYEKDFRSAIEWGHKNLFGLDYVMRRGGFRKYIHSDIPVYRLWAIGALIRQKVETRPAPVFTDKEIEVIASHFRKLASEWPEKARWLNIIAFHCRELCNLYHRLYQTDQQIREKIFLNRSKRIIAVWDRKLSEKFHKQIEYIEIGDIVPVKFHKKLYLTPGEMSEYILMAGTKVVVIEKEENNDVGWVKIKVVDVGNNRNSEYLGLTQADENTIGWLKVYGEDIDSPTFDFKSRGGGEKDLKEKVEGRSNSHLTDI